MFAVVGHGDRGHALFLDALAELFDVGSGRRAWSSRCEGGGERSRALSSYSMTCGIGGYFAELWKRGAVSPSGEFLTPRDASRRKELCRPHATWTTQCRANCS